MVVLVSLLGYVAMLPNAFHVERSARIDAPPERVYALIDDFPAWAGWSPWEKLDPELRRVYSGAPSGVGAEYAWQGNEQVGAGRMRIVEAIPPSKLVIALDFLEPFEASNTAVFTLEPDGGATRVTWAMDGDHTFFSKLIGLVVDTDSLVGADFEKGLADLEALAEQPAASATQSPAPAATEPPAVR
jgi:uncharacterized protein YndB with AHSA1/START domain